MAFGFSPKYQLEARFNDLTKEHFLVLGIEAAKKLDWNIGAVHENSFVAYTKFSMGSWSEEVTVNIDGDLALLRSECAGSQIFDWGKNKRNIEDFITTFKELKESISLLTNWIFKFEELRANISNEVQQTPYTVKRGSRIPLSIFIPVEGYFITPILIDLNIGIFLLMVVSGVSIMMPDSASLLKWGANFRAVTLDGQAWRLFTSCFIHIGVFHLLMNMYALAYVGVLLEPQLGKGRFAIAYVFTGLIASSASLWWHDFTISAGASGAIFGLYGVFLSMLTTDLIEKSARKTLITSVVVFIGYNLMNGLKAGIDNAAHLGGLVGGVVIGFMFIPSLRDQEEAERKIKAIFFVAVLTCGVVVLVYNNIRNDIGEHDKRMKDFVTYESMALDFYGLPDATPRRRKAFLK